MMTMSTRSIARLVPLVVLLGASAVAQQELPPPEATEVWDPVPITIDPGDGHRPPSDAIVLFDGTDLSNWSGRDGDARWDVGDGAMTVRPGSGNLTTERAFGDVQLHVEWRTPAEIVGEGQGRGNSGVFLMEKYEVQVLDSWRNPTYVNGQAASIFKQHIPLVNASRGPGEWQAYDIIFTAPRFGANGTIERPATMTVLHNGVLVQNHVTITGETVNRGVQRYEAHADKLPILLQDHDHLVSYRNIWVREI